MALWTVVTVTTIFGSIADAVPIIAFPLNSQVPPVARVSEPFSYTFSNSTFYSDLPLSYTLSNAPSWLSIDSNTRTLSGTPSATDVGTNAVTGIDFGLTASDQTGSITLNATLVISTNAAPVIAIPLSTQLGTFGTASLPSTILYHPSTDFKFTFEPGTFTENSGSSGLNYYSVTLGNTPLPSWIQFDGSSLSFSGRTPDYQSLIQPPQTFGIELIASEVEGFSGVSIAFEIEVGVHLLAFKNADLVINGTAGQEINFDGLSNSLELDGVVANLSNLTSIIAQAPSWLSFDNSTFILSGTVPADAVPMNVTVQATDIYGDTDNATVFIDIVTAIFSAPIGRLNITSGSPFSFDFSSHVRNKSDVEMTAEFSPMTSWIAFDSQTFIMSGTAPLSTPESKISVTLTATSKLSQTSISQTFHLFVAPGINEPSTSASSASHSPTSTSVHISSSDISTPASISSRKGQSKGVIAAIAVPISLLVLSIILLLCCYRKRRRAAKRQPKSPAKSEISAPMEVSSTVIKVVRPTHTVPPAPLQLDMSGFTTEHPSSSNINESKRRSRKLTDSPLRRSQTMSAVSGPLSDEFRLSDTMRARAYSDNALSRTDKSWRTTQDSAYPTISSSSRTNSSQRLTRNYSRKGQNQRSRRIKSRDSTLRISMLSMQQSQSTTLNVGDDNFSFTPLDNFSAFSTRTSTHETSECANAGGKLQHSISTKRKSRFVPGINPKTGAGHGGRQSIAYLAGLAAVRSVGHGQNWETGGVPRDATTWLTVNPAAAGREQDRLSNVSAVTENTDVLDSDQVAPRGIHTNPTGHIPPPLGFLSDSSGSARPVSRRAVGPSPFFAGGGSMRSSRKPPNKIRTVFAGSPTVPEEPMVVDSHDTVMGDLREESTTPRDSFGISYGAAREGTRQLRSYLQRGLTRGKTNGSMKSNESNDSRFESADSLHQSLPNIVVHARSPEVGQPEPEGEDEYEDYLPDDYSEGSWETRRTPPRDSLGNLIEYGLGESPEVATAIAQRHALAPSTSLRSHPTSPLPPYIGPNARMVSGRGKRPFSVDAGANQGSVRAIVESDYAAYI
jgi:axial budding pattern protein 2